jgi:hypothetical protein
VEARIPTVFAMVRAQAAAAWLRPSWTVQRPVAACSRASLRPSAAAARQVSARAGLGRQVGHGAGTCTPVPVMVGHVHQDGAGAAAAPAEQGELGGSATTPTSTRSVYHP